MEIMEFCTPDGTPWPVIWRSMGPSKRMRLNTTRSGPVDRRSLIKHMTALTAWLMTVATAAPATPIWSGPTKIRSKITFTIEEKIR